jgi:hypothetical protein
MSKQEVDGGHALASTYIPSAGLKLRHGFGEAAMKEKPCSDPSPELPTSDSVTPQRPTETPPGQQMGEQKTIKLLLDKTALFKLEIATLLLILISVLLKLLLRQPWIVNIATSLALTAICVLIFKWATNRYIRELLTVILAMWLPIGVTAVAGVLLFYEGQGRDLGVGLLAAGNTKLFMLFLILIYWAVNNWHSARLGLNHPFPSPTGSERWLFWTPRLLGVCVHFFAAMSLALASWGLSPAKNGTSSILKPLELLVFTAPAAIILVTFSAWAIDVKRISKRPKKPVSPITATWIENISLFLVIAFFVGLWLVKESLPEGLFPGTLWISASAFFFLFVISLHRRSFVRQPVNHDTFTIVLALIAVVVGGLIWYWPIRVADFLGSLNVCFFAFGAAIAILNGVGCFAKFFIGRGIIADGGRFAVLSCTFLLLLAGFTSLLRDFHRVRLCAREACPTAPTFTGWSAIRSIEGRPTVREAALAWYDQAEQLYHKNGANKEKPVPMLVIATAGGGIRAAFWTATVLEQLQADLEEKGGRLQSLVFAISGVSGGSVGAMNYIAALHARDALGKDVRPTKFLQSDFLAPAIASMFFVDVPSNFLPDLGQLDRGTALERSFEEGSEGYLSFSFLSFFPDRETSKRIWRPALLLNATHLETGRRIIASTIKIERHIFLDSFDEFNLLESDMPASTVAHNSARFTYVSPAGKLMSHGGRNRGYVIDGGYFENYGALTALELARHARLEIEKEKGKGKVKLVILQISSDPTLTEFRTRVRTINNGSPGCGLTTANSAETSNEANYLRFMDSGFNPHTHRWHNNDGEGWVVSYLNELVAPLQGVTAVREARGTLAAAELASAVCAEQHALWASAPQVGQKQELAPINDLLGSGTSSRDSNTIQASTQTASDATSFHAEPHFAHLAMCEVSEIDKAPIVPPLGWVLSKSMREKFPEIIEDCGNKDELGNLKKVLN